MTDPRIVYLLVSGLEALLGLALAWLFLRYWRQLERPYLRLWAGSFAALAVYLLASGMAFLLAREGGALLSARTGFTLLAQVSAYLHIALLVLGTLSLQARRDPPPYLVRGVLGAALLLGLTASLMFAWDPEAVSGRVIMRIGMRYLIAAAAYAGVALALLGAARERGLGRRLTGLAFALFALASLAGFAISTVPEVGRHFGDAAVWLALFDLVAVAGIGIGLFVWLHDEERGRAQSATLALERASFFDPATRLPNRRLFVRRLRDWLEQVERGDRPLGVLVLRPDRSARLRDALGEGEFDVLLMQAAQQLDAAQPAAQPATARLEDDRLALALPPMADAAALQARAEALLAGLGQRLSQRAGFTTFSAGLAQFPEDGDSAESLLNAAVSAQARAEQAGGNRLLSFSAELQRREREDLILLSELHQAIGRDALSLHLQPIVELASGVAAHHEALLRWNHPQRGLLMPDVLLPLAEGAGLLPELDLWTLRAACRLLESGCESGLRIAVNLTAPSFLQQDLVPRLEDLLRRHRLPGDRLMIEITEAIAVDDPQAAAITLAGLRRLGVKVALDDVGTGYSSLDQLRRLRFDVLKVDRVFVADIGSDPRDAAVARALITLGRSLGLAVVVEGIETEAQLAFARAEGAEFGQGFMLGRPRPAV